MSEQKVWVEKMPESCDECKYYTQFTDGMGCMVAQELRPMDEQDNYMQAACPLQSIKAHDRELVKEVCEKIIERYNLEGKPITGAFGDTQYGYIMVSAKDLKQFLDSIQKDIENG